MNPKNCLICDSPLHYHNNEWSCPQHGRVAHIAICDAKKPHPPSRTLYQHLDTITARLRSHHQTTILISNETHNWHILNKIDYVRWATIRHLSQLLLSPANGYQLSDMLAQATHIITLGHVPHVAQYARQHNLPLRVIT